MATKIKIKNSETTGKIPTPADLDRAELAINLTDKKIYTKDQTDNIIELGSNTPWWDLQQDLGSVNGNITIDTSNGRIVLMQVNGPITNVTINDPNNPKTGRMVLKFKTNGSTIDWSNAIDGWIGAHPLIYQAGTHIINLIKIDGKWTGEYEGSEIPKNPPFKMTVRTTAPAHDFVLPFHPDGTYNCQVEWDDGTPATTVTAGKGAALTHRYAIPGDYQITIIGTMTHIDFNASASASDLISIDAWGDTGLTNAYRGFNGCTNLVSVCAGDRSTTGDTYRLTNAREMFQGCTSLIYVPLFDTSHVTSAVLMFDGCDHLKQIAKFDFGRATELKQGFKGCSVLQSFPAIDFPNCTDFTGVWQGCSSLSSFPHIDVSKGANFTSAWQDCTGLTTFPHINVSKGANFTSAWQDCTGLVSFPALDLPEATSLKRTWLNCSGLVSFPNLGGCTKVTNCFEAWQNTSSMVTWIPTDFPVCTDFRYAWRDSGITSFPVINMNAGETFLGTWQGTNLVHFPDINFPAGKLFGAYKIGAWMDCKSLETFDSYRFPVATDMTNAWNGCVKLKTQHPPTMPLVGNLYSAWEKCSTLEDTFVKFLAKVKLDACTDMTSAFHSCGKLTGPFPMKNTGNVTNMMLTFNHSGLSGAFPAIDTSKVTTFHGCWEDTDITSMPVFSTAGVTSRVDAFRATWRNCGQLTTFPPNIFDALPDAITYWQFTFGNTNLNVASKNNILSSLNDSAIIAGIAAVLIDGGQALDATAKASWNSLKTKGWTGNIS
jgi:hypothetical protein